MTVRIFRPTYLIEELGEQGRLPDGAIVNIGGTAGPYFTVGGRTLLFSDGSTTGPGGSSVNLQNVYDNGINGQINLVTNKNFVLNALNGRKLTFNSDTGKVTIDGDLDVLGQSNVIEGTISNLDQVNIGTPNSTTVGLTIKPNSGVIPTANLIEISTSFLGAPVFKVDALGATTVSNLYVSSGLINGINLQSLADHINGALLPAKHAADQISYVQGANTNVVGTNVQQALDSIESAISVFTASDVQGFEHVQLLASDTWTVVHNANSKKLTVQVWDSNDEAIIVERIKILTPNTVEVLLNTPMTGRAILMIF
jgi:hypothetical protein